jgi:hypothetical protein
VLLSGLSEVQVKGAGKQAAVLLSPAVSAGSKIASARVNSDGQSLHPESTDVALLSAEVLLPPQSIVSSDSRHAIEDGTSVSSGYKSAPSFESKLAGGKADPREKWLASIIQFLRCQRKGVSVPLVTLRAKFPRPKGVKGNLKDMLRSMDGLHMIGAGYQSGVSFWNGSAQYDIQSDQPGINSSQITEVNSLNLYNNSDFVQQEIEHVSEKIARAAREVEFQKNVVTYHLRRSSKDYTEEEAKKDNDLLGGIAGFYGCHSADELVEKLALIYGEDQTFVRTKMIVLAKEVNLKSKQYLMASGVKSEGEVELFLRNFKIPVIARVLPEKLGFVQNKEVDDHHDKCMASAAAMAKLGAVCIPNPYAERSTTGMLVYASLDELTEVWFQTLLLHPVELPVHSFKLKLIVVRPAFLAAAVTAIVADTAGQHVRIAVYNTGVIDTAQAQSLFPVGAIYYLKHPLLKRCGDSWLGLRVDDPKTLVRLDAPLSGNVLVVGDGDFTFSRALARRNANFGWHANITATSLDSRSDVLRKYSSAASSLAELENESCVEVLHNVDATALQSIMSYKRPQFDIIIWNFPYPVDLKSVQPAREKGSELLGRFFDCLHNHSILKDDGHIHITLAPKQGGSTLEANALSPAWSVQTLAARSGFDLFEVAPFPAEAYAGYSPRREYIDQTFPCNEPRVHFFRRKKFLSNSTLSPRNLENRSNSAERHMGARLASVIHNNAYPKQGLSPQTGQRIPTSCLAKFADSSATARSLLIAEHAFAQLYALILSAGMQGPDETREISLPLARRVVDLLDQAYSVRDGELLAEWASMDSDALKFAFDCAITIARRCLVEAGVTLCSFKKASWADLLQTDADFGMTEAATWADQQARAGLFSVECLLDLIECINLNTNRTSNMLKDEIDGLAPSLFAVANLLQHIKYTDSFASIDLPLEMLSSAINFGIHDARFYRRRATLLSFRLNQVEASSSASGLGEATRAMEDLVCRILADCESALQMNPEDSEAIYIKAFAMRSVTTSDSNKAATQYLQAIKLYELYLKLVEPDDRCAPTAYYTIGFLKLCVKGKSLAQPNPGSIRKILVYYNQGLEAESRQLPCLPPRTSHPAKEILATLKAAFSAAGLRP